jgi:hypothetical protein
MAQVQQVLHRLLWSAPKREFWVQWSGLGAFIAKNSDVTLFRTCALMAPFRPVWHQFCAVTKRCEMTQNMSFGSNGVDWGRSLRKLPTSFVKRTCALMALVRSIFHRLSCINKTVRNDTKYEFWVQWSGSGAFVAKKFRRNFV